jgi:anti-anti-sigma factor
MPVEDGWDGKPFKPSDITGSTQSIEGNVSRAEGRGVFFVRMLSFAEQDVANQVRTGQLSKDNLKIESSEAGLVVTIKLQGRLAMESATRLKPYLNPQNQNMILLDCTGLSYVAKNSVNMLYLNLKEAWENNKHICLLINSGSSVEDMLRDSKISDITDIQTDRDEAVAGLLSRNLT